LGFVSSLPVFLFGRYLYSLGFWFFLAFCFFL